MRELDPASLVKVSGGAFDVKKSAQDFFNFLMSDKNPLKGENIGKAVGEFGVNIMLSFVDAFIKPWLKNKSELKE